MASTTPTNNTTIPLNGPDCDNTTHQSAAAGETNTDDPNVIETTPPQSKFWRFPWWMALVLFFVFAYIWAYLVVIWRYWIREDWTAALPGLGTTELRKLSMRSHMTLGAIAMLLSPIQMTTPLANGWKRPGSVYRLLHRWFGRVYVVCAILSFVFGQWFIVLKEFRLVGGYNMGVAFSLAGFFIAYFAYMTWKNAPTHKNGNIQDHKNYAIRSFSQIIAPLFYRYAYVILAVVRVYVSPGMGKDLICDDHNVCAEYKRPFDAIHCWLYWMVPWGVAEIVILCLPKHEATTGTQSVAADDDDDDDTSEGSTPLLSESDSNPRTTYQTLGPSTMTGVASDPNKSRVMNGIGCIIAGITVLGTGPMLIGLFSKLLGSESSVAMRR